MRVKRFKRVGLFCTAACVLCGTFLYRFGPVSGDVPAWNSGSGMPLLIIDAGHGGEDGGAVSLTGEHESRINLAIAKKLDLMLGVFGAPVLMLRQEDVSLHDPDAKTLREKKVSDLHNRAAKVQEQENGVLLSIHQNSYPSGRYSGAQVFYAPTAGSDVLAQAMQDTLRSAVDPENQRQAKPIPDTIYLMNHITCPAVLVECGFLTNAREEQLLRSSQYQTDLAAAMAGCWLVFNG